MSLQLCFSEANSLTENWLTGNTDKSIFWDTPNFNFINIEGSLNSRTVGIWVRKGD